MLRLKIKYGSASTRGRSHEVEGQVCQDKVQVIKFAKNIGLAVLADGAGSAALSHDGAQRVIQTLANQLKAYPKPPKNWQEQSLWIKIVTEVYSDLKAFAEQQHQPLKEFASTLLFVYTFVRRGKVHYCSGHIGDGVIVISQDEKAKVLSHPWRGEYANTTLFLTNGNIEQNLRLQFGDSDRDVGFLLLSDGTASSLYHNKTKTLAPACDTIFKWPYHFKHKEIQESLQKGLDTLFKKQTQDDCSICLLSVTGISKSYV